MKKILLLILLSVSSLCFTGCDLLFSILLGGDYGSEEVKTFDVDKAGDVYLLKYNKNKRSISTENTGYVTGINNNFQTDELPVVAFDPSIFESAKSGPQDSKFVQNMNQKIMNSYNEYSARSAGDDFDYSRQIIPDTSKIGDKKNFFYLTGENETSFEEATCQYVGKYCTVWYIDDINGSFDLSISDFGIGKGYKGTDCSFSALGKKFDSLYALEEKYLGKHTYTESKGKFRLFGNDISDAFEIINPNEKITILVADLYGDAEPDLNGGVYGYFYSGDMFDIDQTIQDQKIFFSNGIQMLYLDSYFYKYDTYSLYSTIVHEYNHMLNFVQKTVKNNVQFSTWFTEMLAMISEDMFEDYLSIPTERGPQSRLPYFNSYPWYGFTEWGNDNEVYISYANAYAFGAFLARNYGGLNLISKIATSEYVDFDAITNATGKSLDVLLQNFAQTFINTEKTTSTTVYSLNKAADTRNTDGLRFKAIDLSQIQSLLEFEVAQGVEYDRYDPGNLDDPTDDKYYQTIVGPVIYRANPRQQSSYVAPYEYYACPLMPQGFSVHYVGSDLDNFELKYNTHYGIDYKVVIK